MEISLKNSKKNEYYYLHIPLQKGFDVLNHVYKYNINELLLGIKKQ